MELEKSGDKAIIAWLKETAQRGYSNDKIKEVLSSSGYDIKAVQAVLALREELKRKKKLFVRKEAEAEDKRLSKDPANIPEEIREVYELLSLTREVHIRTTNVGVLCARTALTQSPRNFNPSARCLEPREARLR